MKTSLWIFLIAILLSWPVANAEVGTSTPSKIKHAKIGALITDVGDFDNRDKRFAATFWLWTLSASKEESALENLSFPNAIEISESSIKKVATPKGYWVTRKIHGTFRHPWNMSEFPFDGQTLIMRIEVTGTDYSRLRFIDDGITSIVDSDLEIPGWKIEGASLYADKSTYRSSFGDPRISKNSEVSYTAADVSITLRRTNYAAFWKLTIAAFVAAGLAIPAFFVNLDAQSRLGLLTASVFADVLSMQSASSDLGAVEYITLVDKIHIIILMYTFIATVFVLYTHGHFSKHSSYNELKWDGYRVGVISTLLLVTAISTFIFNAWSA